MGLLLFPPQCFGSGRAESKRFVSSEEESRAFREMIRLTVSSLPPFSQGALLSIAPGTIYQL